MFLFQKWLGSPFPEDVWAWWLLMHWLQLQFTPCEALPSVWISFARQYSQACGHPCCLCTFSFPISSFQSTMHLICFDTALLEQPPLTVMTLCDLPSFGAYPLHGTARYGSVRFTFGGFSTGYCTWYFFSTTSAEVPSEPYRYQNVTSVGTLLITDWPKRIVITASMNLRHETHRPARFKSAQPANAAYVSTNAPFCINHKIAVSLSVEEVQTLADSRGADPVRAWWRDAEGKSLMYILLNLLYFQSMSSVYIFTFVSVFCFN